ncbi:outer membrane protein OmpA-like peptidoglycan-associated protein [Prosthecobacter fusiformis]|uniref:Outer membrane protein OmpA-like peptidoglycan-associated protein n=1 Tax=Prosthecobacter fusiformis TaxID=48464 RepID=A0A4V6Q5C6_9BACT|nr:OmpA family protein [Prosthecobacter fusiformis]TDU69423.1 outer membrane protein OmpA-like peptidoglycan-associated protein [Prosthecobacter fusiformis]
MKSCLIFLPTLALACLPLQAQVTVVTPQGSAGVEVVRPAGRVLDSVEARRQLSVAPQIMVPPASAVTVIPADTVKTTKTTTVVQTPGQPTRVYNAERNVVIVQDQNEKRELPYVTLPVLFVKETSELLDNESRTALEQIAGVILAIAKTEAGTVFDIEGHTSTDGTDDYNLELSAARAKRVFDELTQNYGVPANVLSAHGYGEMFPMYPAGTEQQMQMDRRVLVVRTK